MKPNTICTAKHTAYQPTDKEFRCPKCGAAPDGMEASFVIEDPDADGSEDCSLLHNEDGLVCTCGYQTTGKRFAAMLAKRKDLVQCPCCKGTGTVSTKRAAELKAQPKGKKANPI